MRFGSVDIRLPDGASASIDDVEVYVRQRQRPPQRRAGGRNAACRADRSGGVRLGDHPGTAPVVAAPARHALTPSKLAVMPVRTALSPGVLSPTLPVPKSIPRPEYVGKPTAQEGTEPWVQTPEVIEKMRVAGRIAAGALAEAGKARRARRDDRRTGPHRARLHGRPRRLSVDAGLQGIPEVVLHVAERGHLPRHPRLDGDRRRRHRQHRRHRLHRRRARRHQRHVSGRRRLRRAPAARRAHPRGDDAGDQSRQTRACAVGRRPRHRVLRKPVRLQRRSRLHRSRHRHHLSQRAGRAALRPALRRRRSSSRE